MSPLAVGALIAARLTLATVGVFWLSEALVWNDSPRRRQRIAFGAVLVLGSLVTL